VLFEPALDTAKWEMERDDIKRLVPERLSDAPAPRRGRDAGMLAAWWSRVIATSALGRWRDRADAGHFVRPHEQNGAGRVVHDKARRRAQAVRSQAGAVAVTGRHQQVSRLCGSHDLPLDASSADHLDDPGSSEQPGGSREESFPRSRRFGRHLSVRPGRGRHRPINPSGAAPAAWDTSSATTYNSDTRASAGMSGAAATTQPSQVPSASHTITCTTGSSHTRSDSHRATVEARSTGGTVSAPNRRNSDVGGSAWCRRNVRRHSSVARTPRR